MIGGLDWSGDTGVGPTSLDTDPWLVVGSVHMSIEQHVQLDQKLGDVRRRLRLPPGHPFKYVRSTERTRAMLLAETRRLPLAGFITAFNKRQWMTDPRTGMLRLRDALVFHIEHINPLYVSGQTLLIDAGKGERGFIRDLNLYLRRSQAIQGRAPFKKIAARPDTRTDAALVQMADLYAGLARRALMQGNWPELGEQIVITIV